MSNVSHPSMSLGGVFQVRESVLRGLLFGMGGFFVLVAALILFTHQWQPSESRLVLLVPCLSGFALIALPLLLRGLALRLAGVVVPLVVPALVWLTWRSACAFHVINGASCG